MILCERYQIGCPRPPASRCLLPVLRLPCPLSEGSKLSPLIAQPDCTAAVWQTQT